jgi:hypothetical protein
MPATSVVVAFVWAMSIVATLLSCVNGLQASPARIHSGRAPVELARLVEAVGTNGAYLRLASVRPANSAPLVLSGVVTAPAETTAVAPADSGLAAAVAEPAGTAPVAADPAAVEAAPGVTVAAPVPAEPAQGQFFGGQFLDPCKGQAKNYISISQTGNTQLAAGTSSKKVYICSMHVVVAAATNVAVVEGTGTVCATGTSGVGGFGGATAATGWNFAANGGIAMGNGDSSLGAEVTSGDNLCLFSSGSGQVSGGMTYVVQ